MAVRYCSKHVGRDFMAGLKNIVGGELKGYTELLEESRQEAMSRMIDKARALGAQCCRRSSVSQHQILLKVPLNYLCMAQLFA